MKTGGRSWLGPVSFTVGLILLVSVAVGMSLAYGLILLFTVAAGAVLFYVLFPGSRFFTVAFANFLAVYACVFVFFIESNFQAVPRPWIQLGFALPILAFLGGSWWRREAIRGLLETPRLRDAPHFARIFLWLIPVFAIGALTFPLSEMDLDPPAMTAVLLGSMGLTAAIVLWVSRDVCTFLLDTGLLFEDFFRRLAGLLVPVFAFFTFYSMIVIVFAAVYRIIDRLSPGAHFAVAGEARDLSFTESLYFSIITLSTVGYGDIVPLSNLVQLIVSAQIVCGVVLLLFGFSEIIGYSRHGARYRQGDRQGDRQ